MKSVNSMFIIFCIILGIHSKEIVELCYDNKDFDNCGKFSDENGYCCKMTSENSPSLIQRCQYYNKNEFIFSGFYLSSIKYNVDCQENKAKILSDFYIHEHHQCGSLSPNTTQDCSFSNSLYIFNDDYNCCMIQMENSDKKFCVKTSFPNDIISNYTLSENNRNFYYFCSEILNKISFILLLFLVVEILM